MAGTDLWGSRALVSTEGINGLGLARPINSFGVVRLPPLGLYAGSFADRQSRFHFRSLRRSGVYLGDLTTVVLWMGNGNGCACPNDSCL
jgi:hypothetical protein